MTEKKLVIDQSLLTHIALCSTKAYLSGALGRKGLEEPIPIMCGSAVHKALAVYLSTGSIAHAIQVLREEYTPHVQDIPGNSVYALPNVLATIQAWCAAHAPVKTDDTTGAKQFRALPFVFYPSLIEVPFVIPHGDDVLLVGVLDALVKHVESGGWWVLDHKTVFRYDPTYRDTLHTATQFTIYARAAKAHLTKGEPLEGVVVNIIELSAPRARSAKGKQMPEPRGAAELVYTDRSDDEIERVAYRTVNTLVQRYLTYCDTPPDNIDTIAMEGRYIAGACTRCQFAPVCRVEKRAPLLPVLTTTDTWRPVPHLPRPGQWWNGEATNATKE